MLSGQRGGSELAISLEMVARLRTGTVVAESIESDVVDDRFLWILARK